jgi:hypothetical protein
LRRLQRVNALALGFFPSELTGELADPALRTRIRQRTLLDRALDLTEIDPLLFPGVASYVTGQVLTVDGGWTAANANAAAPAEGQLSRRLRRSSAAACSSSAWRRSWCVCSSYVASRWLTLLSSDEKARTSGSVSTTCPAMIQLLRDSGPAVVADG